MATGKPDFQVGQDVVILPGSWGRKAAPVFARITRVARVWMDVESTGSGFPSYWRIRKDTRDEGSKDYPQGNARLYTLEQWAEHLRGREARAFLKEQGIELRLTSPWNGRETELAELIRKAITDGREKEQ